MIIIIRNNERMQVGKTNKLNSKLFLLIFRFIVYTNLYYIDFINQHKVTQPFNPKQ